MSSRWQVPFQPEVWRGQGSDRFTTIHLMHLWTGRFLMWGYGQSVWSPRAYSTLEARLWTPPPVTAPDTEVGSFTPAPNFRTSLFCGGHCQLADGRLFSAGGDFLIPPPPSGGTASAFYAATEQTDLFDPQSNLWQPGPNMAFRRWYSTLTALGDRRVLIMLGELLRDMENNVVAQALIPEVYNFQNGSMAALNASALDRDSYPMIFVLSNGDIAYVGGQTQTALLPASLVGPWRVGAGQGAPPDTFNPARYYGSVAMYHADRIMKIGGSLLGASNDAVAACSVFNGTTRQWSAGPALNLARMYHNAVILADGSLLVVGGQNGGVSRLAAETLKNPTGPNPTWLLDEFNMDSARDYHSTAALMRDGRVIVAGGQSLGSGFPNPSAQIYRPHYFNLNQAKRPVITDAPGVFPYRPTPPTSVQIKWEAAQHTSIAKVHLIKLASVTHGIDMDQRLVPLGFSADNGTLIVELPLNGNHAPPGWYMLFIVNDEGCPSEGKYVQVGP